MFPKLPSWEGLHPLVVHFPIALLIAAPVLVVLGLVLRRHGRGLAIGALALMVLGTAGAWVAVSTGEAGAQIAERGTPAVEEAIQHHEEAAENVRTIFTVLTLLFAALTLLPASISGRLSPRVLLGITLLFLAAYGGATLYLARTAHLGGVLVHEHGIRALI